MPKDSREVKALIHAAQRGDEQAFEKLLLMLQTSVYRLAFSMLGSHEDAEDAAQETFVKLWRTLPDYRGECPILPYALRMTRNVALDMLRRLRPMRKRSASMTVEDEQGESVTLDVPDTDENSDPSKAFARRERIEAVRRAVDELSPEHREILVLKDMQGYSYEQIARVLELNEGTVKSRLSRARRKLGELLKERNIL